MQPPDLNWIANFIWGIADDVLRDLYVRGKYRDVILPMTVLRRLDAVLEPTKARVLETKAWLDRVGITSQDGPLRDAARQAFYNTSRFTLRDLRARGVEPMALLSLMARLGSSKPVDLVSSMDELVAGFDVGSFGAAPTKFDAEDLFPLTRHHVQSLPFSAVKDRIAALGVPEAEAAGCPAQSNHPARRPQ